MWNYNITNTAQLDYFLIYTNTIKTKTGTTYQNGAMIPYKKEFQITTQPFFWANIRQLLYLKTSWRYNIMKDFLQKGYFYGKITVNIWQAIILGMNCEEVSPYYEFILRYASRYGHTYLEVFFARTVYQPFSAWFPFKSIVLIKGKFWKNQFRKFPGLFGWYICYFPCTRLCITCTWLTSCVSFNPMP